MKDKEREEFYKTPAVPSEIKALIEQRKREEIEKLEKADEAGRNLGINYDPPKINRDALKKITGGEDDGGITGPIDNTKPDTDAPPVIQRNNDSDPKPAVKPAAEPPAKKPEPPAEKPKPEGAKKKGKKGDDKSDDN
jgi:hypothetical protein